MREFFVAMGLYVVVLIASVTVLHTFEVARTWQIVLSRAPALPVLLVIIANLRLMMNSHELQQRVHRLAITVSAVLTGLITFSYGFLENVGFPKLTPFTIFPMLFVLWGVGLAYFTRRYE